MDIELMLKEQRVLIAACDYLDMRCLASNSLRAHAARGEVDTKSYNSLINTVIARLTRQEIMAKRHLDNLV